MRFLVYMYFFNVNTWYFHVRCKPNTEYRLYKLQFLRSLWRVLRTIVGFIDGFIYGFTDSGLDCGAQMEFKRNLHVAGICLLSVVDVFSKNEVLS